MLDYSDYQAAYTVTGSSEMLTCGITNISSHSESFSFDGTYLSIASGLDSVDSPITVTLTATNSYGTVVAAKTVTVYIVSLDPSSLYIEEGAGKDDTVYVFGAGSSYTLSLQNAPSWVALFGNIFRVTPPSGTVTGGMSQDFAFNIVVTVGGQSVTLPFTISVTVP